MARPGLVPAILAVVALAATGCSLPEAEEAKERTNADAAHGSPYPTLAASEAGAPTIDVVAPGPQATWEKSKFTAKAGVVNIAFTSKGNSNHNLNLVGPGAPYPLLWGVETGAPEERLTHAVELQKGVYTFYCSVQGHRQAGMEGTITVE
ncbi:MAG TPA: plastocyanin/azurin family copper-binding protein [Frankiaceae bacterium]|nr:plastocyanin/azurin family copper-binding protein [Frankiaceae bacterium]